MIGLNTNSAYLQNQIISGFESVSQGFNTKSTGGVSGLQAAIDSFSSFDAGEMTNLAGLGSQQQISGIGEFSSPATYLHNQLAGSGNENPLLRAFKDPQLGGGADLSHISAILTQIASAAEKQGIIIVSGSPTQLQQQGASRLEQAGLMTPPQIGGSTRLEQAGLMTPPQYGGFAELQQQASSRLEQAGLMTPPQIGGSTRLEQAGIMAPPQYGGVADLAQQASSRLEQAGLMTPPQIGGSTRLEQAGLMTPPQVGPLNEQQQQEITFSPQQANTLLSMSNTVRNAANLFQNMGVSMLNRRILV